MCLLCSWSGCTTVLFLAVRNAAPFLSCDVSSAHAPFAAAWRFKPFDSCRHYCLLPVSRCWNLLRPRTAQTITRCSCKSQLADYLTYPACTLASTACWTCLLVSAGRHLLGSLPCTCYFSPQGWLLLFPADCTPHMWCECAKWCLLCRNRLYVPCTARTWIFDECNLFCALWDRTQNTANPWIQATWNGRAGLSPGCCLSVLPNVFGNQHGLFANASTFPLSIPGLKQH